MTSVIDLHRFSGGRATQPDHSGGGKAVPRCTFPLRDGGALNREPEREPDILDDLALLLRSITYGEMIALGLEIAAGAPIAAVEELAPALYLWAMGRAR